MPELEALVLIADTGSMERAAKHLSLTPSAFTRRIQRLENELGVVLLDRRFKPPKITRDGFEVLERSRGILSSVTDLKSLMSGHSEPKGTFRLGLSHALAEPELSSALVALRNCFPLVQPTLRSDISSQLLASLRAGELDSALVVIPIEGPIPDDIEGVQVSQEQMRPVQAKASAHARGPSPFYRRRWVLNPTGCMVRELVKNKVERLGSTFSIAAELHSPDLQLSLIASDIGVGIIRDRVLRRHRLRNDLTAVRHPEFDIKIRIAFYRAKHLGAREQVSARLQQILVNSFKSR